jgi:hypothetical protein
MVSYLGIFLGCALAGTIRGVHEAATGRPIFRGRHAPMQPPLTGRARIWHAAMLSVIWSMATFSVGSLILMLGAFRGWWPLPSLLIAH